MYNAFSLTQLEFFSEHWKKAWLCKAILLMAQYNVWCHFIKLIHDA